MKKLNIVFMGTPDFALPALEALVARHNVICVYTGAAKPKGRGYDVIPSPVAVFADKKGIEVRTPLSFKPDAEKERFIATKADIAVVAAYGFILPSSILSAFPMGCVNIHGSLLPRWRGAAPIQRAIMAGDKETGITIMQMAKGCDTGDMLLKKSTFIANKTADDLFKELSLLGAEGIIQFLDNPNLYPAIHQDDNLATFAAKIDKAEGFLDFSQTAEELERKIRAMPCYFVYKGERIKVLSASVKPISILGQVIGNSANSEVSKNNNNHISNGIRNSIGHIIDNSDIICGGSSILHLSCLQRAGKKALPIEDFKKGFSFDNGALLCDTK